MILKKWKTAALFLLLAGMLLPGRVRALEPETVCVGGAPFGVRFGGEGILIVGFSDPGEEAANPAYAAGLRRGDMITEVNGEAVYSATFLASSMSAGEKNGVSSTMAETGFSTRSPSPVPRPPISITKPRASRCLNGTERSWPTASFPSSASGTS